MHWKALDPSVQMQTMYLLAGAKNYEDYKAALPYFKCPGQNFVFADQTGDIAIWEQGEFPLKWPEQGRFVMDGSDPSQQWQGMIPQQDNPHIKNPERGFVSSANQHPTDQTYPYYYNGNFENYRNRRINEVLAKADSHSIDPQFMMKLQNDTYSKFAESFLPELLKVIDKHTWDDFGKSCIDSLKNWDLNYSAHAFAPVLLTATFESLRYYLQDIQRDKHIKIANPSTYNLVRLIKKYPHNIYFDLDSTSYRENADDVLLLSFQRALNKVETWQKTHKEKLTWARYNPTHIDHWLKQIKPFNSKQLDVGGYKFCVDAINETHGPSWRMIVSMENPVKAWGVYPGGESGNPGSPQYDSFINTWANGQYFQLLMLHSADENNDQIILKQQIEPK